MVVVDTNVVGSKTNSMKMRAVRDVD